MKKVRLGRSNVEISQVGFGTGPLGNSHLIIPEERARSTLLAAWKSGITLFDSSPFYGFGLAELRAGQLFREAPRDDFVISTKVGRVADPLRRLNAKAEDIVPQRSAGGVPHTAVFDYSYDGAMRSVEQSMLRLGTDRLDIVLIHDVDVWTHAGAYERRFGEAMEGAYRALDDLRRAKVVAAIGIGVNEADVCARFARAGDFDAMLLAGRYTLLEQTALDEFFPLAKEKGIAVLMGGVLNSGILATGSVDGARYNYQPAPSAVMDKVRRIEEVCREFGVRLLDAALQFSLAHPAVSSLILGAASPTEVAANLNALQTRIPTPFWHALKTASLLSEGAPIPVAE